MIKHYFISTIRGIKFHPFYSLISILGLSIGLGSCLLIFSYWAFEKSFDNFHADSKKIFRIHQEKSLENGGSSFSARIYSKAGEELRNSFSNTESVLRIHKAGQNTSIKAGENLIAQDGIIGAETTFFDFFDFSFISGSPEQWKNTPQAIILTKSLSEKLFGKTNPINRDIIVNGAYGIYQENGYQEFKNYTVAGIIEDLPSNTHLDFSALISLNLYPNPDQEFSNWGPDFYTYVKIPSSNQISELNTSLNSIVEKGFPESGISFHSMPLEEIHLKSNLINEFKANGSETVLFLLAALAFLILVIAACNYINFATARVILRNKEIGVRKIFWAGKRHLFNQLFFEAIFINLIALGVAVLLIILINPLLIEVTSIDLFQQLLYSTSWYLKVGVLALAILFSGIYPAWLVSKGSFRSITSKSQVQLRIQRPLVIFQFAISIFVIGFTLLIASQLRFMKNSNSGLDLEKTLVLAGPSVESEGINLEERMKSFQNSLLANSNIIGLTSANFIPGKLIRGKAEGYVRKLGSPEDEANTYSFTQIDENFIPQFKIEILAGRDFDVQRNEKGSIIINEEAARLLGFNSPEEAIGEKIHYRVNSTPEIIGVVKNFHQFSLQQAYQPIIFELRDQPDLFVFVKYKEASEDVLLSEMKNYWNSSFPENPLSYYFLDDFYDQQYQRDENFFHVFQIFSSLAILVACLGFFGLTYFLASSKIKEIGVRKTLGAGFMDITKILGKGTFGSLLLAGIFSIPLIYFLGSKWLENYAFQTKITFWVLSTPVILFSILSVTLILIQSFRSYLINPISSLQEGSNDTLQR
ncbi:ABC transporter permease [Algoriphagus sp. SE2]|uniref:ABC transporter permease n=1 Tax=Algoriphagus sp. SE2 TaxID=3141536 RepID=UPI0031CD5C5E